MPEIYQSLFHSKWNCKYHVVFVPKGRRRVLLGQARPHLGIIFHALAQEKECRIVEGHVRSDHAPVYRNSPEVSGRFGDWISQKQECHCDCLTVVRPGTGLHRGALLGSGLCRLHGWVELEPVRQYIREQETADGATGRF